MCLSCEPAVAEVRPSAVIGDDYDPEIVRRWKLMTHEERHAAILSHNAAKPKPDPVCFMCRIPFGPKDGHPLIPSTCNSCGGEIFEDIAMNYIFAKGRKARRKAAKRLRALAY